jgi:serine/threonine-protein kinase
VGEIPFVKGDIVRGIWNKNTYRILGILGKGGIGTVYRVQDVIGREIYALKVSEDLQSMTKEYKMLIKFENLSMTVKAKEIDDVDWLGKKFYFIVTECIEGKNLEQYRRQHPITIKSVVALAIVVGKSFQELHRENYVFGDLKLENLMVDQGNGRLKMIDLGGVTQMGSSIKEFTPTYDRASWGVGLRKADEKYDLFSLSILITYLILGSEFPLRERNVDKLVDRLRNVGISPRITVLIHKGIFQKDITFPRFISSLESVYQHVDYFEEKGKTIYRAVNGAFIGSILFFLSVVTFIAIKINVMGKVF